MAGASLVLPFLPMLPGQILLNNFLSDVPAVGMWHTPLMRALEAFVDSTQEHVTGEVRLRLEAGRCDPVGRRAPRSLYDHDLATYDADDAFRHQDSEGFVRLWGLSAETWSRRQGPGAS